MYDFNHVGSDTPPPMFKENPEGNPVPVGSWPTVLEAQVKEPIGAKRDMSAEDLARLEATKGWQFACTWRVVGGPHNGRRAWTRLQWGSKNEKAKKYAMDQVEYLRHACGGVQLTNDLSPLLEIPVSAFWKVEPPTYAVDADGKDLWTTDEEGKKVRVVKYKAKNDVCNFKKISSELVGTIAPATSAPSAAPKSTAPNVPAWAAASRTGTNG